MEHVKLNGDGTAELNCSEEENLKFLEQIRQEASVAVKELVTAANIQPGEIFVVGCSTSEVVGGRIGQASVLPVAKALLDGMAPILREREVLLAAQCCEHLNRALIVERECAKRYGLEVVCVRPVPKAGGSFATAAYDSFEEPVAVEHIRAHAGIDIGGTLIGMNLRDVAVPVRLSISRIGDANIICARTRPKYIGGSRAHYE